VVEVSTNTVGVASTCDVLCGSSPEAAAVVAWVATSLVAFPSMCNAAGDVTVELIIFSLAVPDHVLPLPSLKYEVLEGVGVVVVVLIGVGPFVAVV